MKKNKHILYADGVHGVRVFKIWSKDNVIKICANNVKYEEAILSGKVNRTIEEQVKLRINTRVQIKLDNGFVYDKSELSGKLTNQLGYFMPMLAQRLDRQSTAPIGNVFIQAKFDGHRCLLNNKEAYSRKGKPIDKVGKLFDQIKVPEGVTLDGELYVHNTPLQTIASWAKRYQPNTELLNYFIYDCIIEDDLDAPFESRLMLLHKLRLRTSRSRLVPTNWVNMDDVPRYFKMYRDKNLEGAIIRLAKSPYGIGQRSKGLLKVKHYFDGEFQCIGIECNRLGWGILKLEAENGETFDATAPGTVPDKINAYNDKLNFIGNMATIQYACLTNKGIPFQPVCTGWRVEI